jgi:hypothetical protein
MRPAGLAVGEGHGAENTVGGRLLLALLASAAVSLGALVAATTVASAQILVGGTQNSTVSVPSNSDLTVIGSAQLVPSSGPAAEVLHNVLTFDPNHVPSPGDISVETIGAGQIGVHVSSSGQLIIAGPVPGAILMTSITTEGLNAPGILIDTGQHPTSLNNLTITTFGDASDGIELDNPKESSPGLTWS